jgi:hypothetical protein
MMNSTLLALTLVIGAPALKEPPKKESPLVGRWEEPAGADRLTYEFTPAGDWIISRTGRVIDGKARTYQLVPGEGKEAVDLTEGPAPYLGVFRIRGDELTLWFRYSGEGRPTEKEDGGPGILKLTFRRIKPEK